MVKKFVLIKLVSISLYFAPNIISQGKAVHEKPQSSSDKTIEFYYEPKQGRADLSKRYPFDYADERKRKYQETDSPQKSYIEYTGYSKNYFRIDKNENSLWNGKHWEYSSFPLKVHVKKSSSEYFKQKYTAYIDYAFKIWESTDSRIKFSYTNSAKSADIIFTFEDNLMEKYDENYLGLTDYELGRNNRIIRAFVEIGLLKFDNKKISDGEIKATVIHELGHALGLGHSSNNIDLMYPYINSDSSDKMTYVELSKGDIETIKSVLDLGWKNGYSTK
jgi:predicted Zn-dependent protease